ncbi:MAG TPA: YdeI/OmpD-associated family protein [Candidatus Nanopelagicales bacterium]
MVEFSAELALNGKTATGIEVPPNVIESLNGGKRPAVVVEFGGYSYRTTIGVMGGRHLIPVSAEHRGAAGVQAGDQLRVQLTLDDAPRDIEVPSDLAEALKASPDAGRAFEALSPSNKKRHVLSVSGAKTDETRQRRLAKVIDELESGAS